MIRILDNVSWTFVYLSLCCGRQLEKDTRSDTELEDTGSEDENVVDRTNVCNNNANISANTPPKTNRPSQVKKAQWRPLREPTVRISPNYHPGLLGSLKGKMFANFYCFYYIFTEMKFLLMWMLITHMTATSVHQVT